MSQDTTRPLFVEARGDREIYCEREFDAPRDLVFRLYTDAERLPEFWGPRKYETIVKAWELEPGGRWHMIQKGQGADHEFYGDFRDVNPPESMTWTFEWGGMPGHVSVETVTFEEIAPNRTRMTVISRYDATEDRDGMLNSGMESGMGEMLERFDELLAREQA